MSACEIARTMSLFEIDEALDLLIESAAEQEAEGEIPDDLRTALSEYVDAFGEKIDRIANYIKAQESFAEAAKKEASRLESRRKAAENRIRTCKAFLCWFMSCRSMTDLKGRLNTFTLANNSVESLYLEESERISEVFTVVSFTLTWTEWQEALSLLPPCGLRVKLEMIDHRCKCLDRTRLTEALKAGQVIEGARLVRGQHVRLT